MTRMSKCQDYKFRTQRLKFRAEFSWLVLPPWVSRTWCERWCLVPARWLSSTTTQRQTLAWLGWCCAPCTSRRGWPWAGLMRDFGGPLGTLCRVKRWLKNRIANHIFMALPITSGPARCLVNMLARIGASTPAALVCSARFRRVRAPRAPRARARFARSATATLVGTVRAAGLNRIYW